MMKRVYAVQSDGGMVLNGVLVGLANNIDDALACCVDKGFMPREFGYDLFVIPPDNQTDFYIVECDIIPRDEPLKAFNRVYFKCHDDKQTEEIKDKLSSWLRDELEWRTEEAKKKKGNP